jgi:predicted Co/Zn/Cd cation transporter (cation efflux family)
VGRINPPHFVIIDSYSHLKKQSRNERIKAGEIMNTEEEIRVKTERRALRFSMYGVIFFVMAEGLMALYTSSQSILMDTFYGAADLIMIIVSIRIVSLLYAPANEKHPFGFSQVETIFLTIKGSMLTAVTIGMIMNNIQIIISGGRRVEFTSVAVFELLAALMCFVIILILKRMNRKLESPIVKAEADAWAIDTVASLGLAVAFFLPVIIKTPWMESFSPYLDQAVAIVLSLLILPVPVKIVISGLRDLFLLPPDQDTIAFIKETGHKVLDPYQLEQTEYAIIKTGRKLWISIYFETPDGIISVNRIVKARAELETELLKEYSDLYVELVPEFEIA